MHHSPARGKLGTDLLHPSWHGIAASDFGGSRRTLAIAEIAASDFGGSRRTLAIAEIAKIGEIAEISKNGEIFREYNNDDNGGPAFILSHYKKIVKIPFSVVVKQRWDNN